MKNTFITRNQLLQDCPVGYQIQGFADTQSVNGKGWDVHMVSRDSENANKYHAEYSFPDDAGSILRFTYEILPQGFPNYRCEVKAKIYNGQDHMNDPAF